MDQERYAETRNQSFYGDYLYDMVVPQDHFFRKLRDLMDWSRFTKKLIKLYKGGGVVGRPPFNPGMLLKSNWSHTFTISLKGRLKIT